jgi:hypothetical protein
VSHAQPGLLRCCAHAGTLLAGMLAHSLHRQAKLLAVAVRPAPRRPARRLRLIAVLFILFVAQPTVVVRVQLKFSFVISCSCLNSSTMLLHGIVPLFGLNVEHL